MSVLLMYSSADIMSKHNRICVGITDVYKCRYKFESLSYIDVSI